MQAGMSWSTVENCDEIIRSDYYYFLKKGIKPRIFTQLVSDSYALWLF